MARPHASDLLSIPCVYLLSTYDVVHVTSRTRPSCFSACNIEKLEMGLGTRLTPITVKILMPAYSPHNLPIGNARFVNIVFVMLGALVYRSLCSYYVLQRCS